VARRTKISPAVGNDGLYLCEGPDGYEKPCAIFDNQGVIRITDCHYGDSVVIMRYELKDLINILKRIESFYAAQEGQ